MPGPGYPSPKPYHWRVLFRWWLDPWRELTGGWTTARWLQYALVDHVHTRRYGLETEVTEWFWYHIAAGEHPSIAANYALDEWDL